MTDMGIRRVIAAHPSRVRSPGVQQSLRLVGESRDKSVEMLVSAMIDLKASLSP